MAVIRYCLHRVDNGAHVVTVIDDARAAIQAAALAAWKDQKSWTKLTGGGAEKALAAAIDAALDSGLDALQRASVRV